MKGKQRKSVQLIEKMSLIQPTVVLTRTSKFTIDTFAYLARGTRKISEDV